MADRFTQANRLLAIETPLGKDKLLLRSFYGQERISQLFSFNLDLLAEDMFVDFDQIVGKNVTFSLYLDEKMKERFFNGYVSRFSQIGVEGRFVAYMAEVVPWLWFLTRTSDCQIFQNKSVPDIIKEVFDDYGFKDYDMSGIQGNHTPWEYCTQYRETAFNFVTRLMEEEGIFYFFKHENGKHTLMLGDSPAAHKPCPEQSKVVYDASRGAGKFIDEDFVYDWQLTHELRAGRFTLNEYNFKTPSTSLMANAEGRVDQGGNKTWEIYDYPGDYEKLDEGEVYTKLRMDEEEMPHATINGAGRCRSFVAGFRFDISKHTRRDQDGTYLLTSVIHSAHTGGDFTGAESDEAYYSNNFTCIPIAVPYRPQRVTVKPLMQGSQTAFVVGPAGEEIYVDEYGRVKVQFHWDREGKYDEKSSCWIRTSQPWAGNKWGAAYWPRIGQEVIVDFLEGDPDRPIITGRVYNAESMPPYKLPGEKTKTVIFKSDSSLGGKGFNELRVEDKKDKEQIFIHAQRNKDIRIKKDLFETVGETAHHTVGGDQYELVGGDKHDHVKGDHIEKVDGSASLTVGMDLQEKVGMKYAHDAGMEIHLKAGMNIVIEAGMQISLKAAGSFIDISPAGIAISGPMVLINSGGAPGSGSGSSPDTPKDPQEADKAEAGEKAKLPPPKVKKAMKFSTSATALKRAAENGMPFTEI